MAGNLAATQPKISSVKGRAIGLTALGLRRGSKMFCQARETSIAKNRKQNAKHCAVPIQYLEAR